MAKANQTPAKARGPQKSSEDTYERTLLEYGREALDSLRLVEGVLQSVTGSLEYKYRDEASPGTWDGPYTRPQLTGSELTPATHGEEDARYVALMKESNARPAHRRYSDMLKRIQEHLDEAHRDLVQELDNAVSEMMVNSEDSAVDRLVISFVSDRYSSPSFSHQWVCRRVDPGAVPVVPRF